MTPDMEMRITARNRTAAAFAEVRSELQRTGREITTLQRTTAAIGATIGAATRAFGAVFAGVGIGEVVRGIVDATRDVAELGRQARATGVSFEAYQELSYVFEKVHIEVSSLGQGLREMQDKSVEFAQTGGGRAADALKAIGFNAEKTAEALKDPEQMFKQIIERLGDLDRASQIRYLGDIFGNADGDKFLRLLDLGEQGINDLGDAAHENGRILGDEMEAAASRADAAWTEWMGGLQTKWREFSVNVINFLANIPEPGQAVSPYGGKGAIAGASATAGLMGAPAPVFQPGMLGRGGHAAWVDTSVGTSPSGFGFRDFLDDWEKAQLEYSGGGGGLSRSIDATTSSLKALDLGIDKTIPKVETLADKVGGQLAGAFTNVFSVMRQGGDVMGAISDQIGGLADMLAGQVFQNLFSNFSLGGFGGGATAMSGWGGSLGYQRFAGGGVTVEPAIFGDAGPEAAVPLPDGRRIPVDLRGGGGRPIVNVYNNNGSRVDVQSRQSADGLVLDIVIEAVAKDMARPGGKTHNTLRTVHGTTPSLTRR